MNKDEYLLEIEELQDYCARFEEKVLQLIHNKIEEAHEKRKTINALTLSSELCYYHGVYQSMSELYSEVKNIKF